MVKGNKAICFRSKGTGSLTPEGAPSYSWEDRILNESCVFSDHLGLDHWFLIHIPYIIHSGLFPDQLTGSHVTRTPVFGVLRLGMIRASQLFLNRSCWCRYYTKQLTTKMLIRLRGCSGWAAALLFAYDKQVLTWCGSMFNWHTCCHVYLSHVMTRPGRCLDSIIPNFKTLASLISWKGWFESYLVERNPKTGFLVMRLIWAVSLEKGPWHHA